ncbi:MAG TPA: DMT family transporter [Bacteroidales bacterium]|nr:DMT family transporter [Bacteroidales bacterium]HQB36236.1 DMT family transporter [Bacteroidales bacterium]
MRKRDNTVIWAIIACLLWSTAYSTIKIGLQYDSPLHFAGLRFLISGLLILPFTVRFSVYFALLKEHWKLVFWVTLLQTIMNYILFYLGLDLVPGALGAVIVGSQPLVTAIVASIMDKSEKLTRRKIVTIICGISGVILISAGRQAFKLGSAIELLGVFMIFAANIAVATSNVLISLRSKGINPLVLSSSTLLIGGFIIYLLSLAFEDIPECTKPAEYWIVLVWLGFMAAAAFSIWFRLLQRPHVKVSDLNLWKFIIPVVGAILSWLLVPGENPEWLTVIGMIIISISLIMFHKNGTRVHTG